MHIDNYKYHILIDNISYKNHTIDIKYFNIKVQKIVFEIYFHKFI